MTLKRNNFNITSIYLVIFILLLFIQFLFWKKYANFRAKLEVVNTPPNEKTMKAFTFGDDEFFYRIKSFKVQNMGDTYARNTPLRDYDYRKLYGWFKELEKLDYNSNYLPSMVAYYFSQTQNIEDRIYVVRFLLEHALKNPEKKWWWMYQASYIAYYTMNNKDLGLRIAYLLRKYSPDSAPIWIKQTYSFLLSDRGNTCETIRVINETLMDLEKNKTDEKKEKELNYMKFFLNNEMKKISYEDYVKCMNNQ